MLAPWKKRYDKPRQHIKKQEYFANKGSSSQSYGFSSGCVWMWELNHKEGWALKNWCFQTVVLERTLESPLDSNSTLNFHWKDWCWSWSSNTLATWCKGGLFIRKDPDAGKDWRHEEKGTTEDEKVGWLDGWMAGWHHWLDGHESEQTPGVRDGQGGLACCTQSMGLQSRVWLNDRTELVD